MPSAREASSHRLSGPGPQDPERLLAFVGAHAVPGVESWDGVTYTRSLGLAGGPAVVAITPVDGGYGLTLRLTERNPHSTCR